MRFHWKKKWKALTSPGMTDVCMHAGHDGHATWLIGAAKILAQLTENSADV